MTKKSSPQEDMSFFKKENVKAIRAWLENPSLFNAEEDIKRAVHEKDLAGDQHRALEEKLMNANAVLKTRLAAHYFCDPFFNFVWAVPEAIPPADFVREVCNISYAATKRKYGEENARTAKAFFDEMEMSFFKKELVELIRARLENPSLFNVEEDIERAVRESPQHRALEEKLTGAGATLEMRLAVHYFFAPLFKFVLSVPGKIPPSDLINEVIRVSSAATKRKYGERNAHTALGILVEIRTRGWK